MENTKIQISLQNIGDVYKAYDIIVAALNELNYSVIRASGTIKTGQMFQDEKFDDIDRFKLIMRGNPQYNFNLFITGCLRGSNFFSGYIRIFFIKSILMGDQIEVVCDSDNSTAQLKLIEDIEKRYNQLSVVSKVQDSSKPISSQPIKSTNATAKSKYDVFISHASANKEDYVRKLVASIKKVTSNVWYDEDMLKWGDDLLKEIMNGLEHTEFAIVVFSKDFFGREWTERELKELLEKQDRLGKKIVLPLLYDCTQQEFVEKYKSLNLIKFVEAKKCSIEEVTLQFAGLLIDRKSKQQL